ncbi:MAG: hypothetical protein JXR83_20620 [Deltaproteobacteria bacterium]|nr:hypothetical protein [Deltaproteobacteria bacterium]
MIALLTAVDPGWRGAGERLFSLRSNDKKTCADQRGPDKNWLKKSEQRINSASIELRLSRAAQICHGTKKGDFMLRYALVVLFSLGLAAAAGATQRTFTFTAVVDTVDDPAGS